MPKQKKVIIGLCIIDEDNKVLAKKCLDVKWDINMKDNVKNQFDIDLNTFVAESIHAGVINKITVDNIKELLDEVESK